MPDTSVKKIDGGHWANPSATQLASLASAVGVGLAAALERMGAASVEDPAAGNGEPLQALVVKIDRWQAAHASRVPDPKRTVRLEAESVTLDLQEGQAGEDSFWADERAKLGLNEQHPNLLFMTAVLTHTDTVMNNADRDVIKREEAEKALNTLLFQPVDAKSSLDGHARERLSWWGENGIRGVVYAARLKGNEIQVGILLWAVDFPDMVEKIASLRDSMGMSFDILGDSADFVDDTRVMKGLWFMGGCLLVKNKAADPTTSVGDILYRGKTIEEIEEEARMTEEEKAAKAKLDAAAALAGTAAAANATETVTALAEAVTKATRLEVELGTVKAELVTALAERDTKAAELVIETEKVRVANESLTVVEARASAAETELAAQKATAERSAALASRLETLETMAATVPGVTLFASDEAKATAVASILEMDDSAFETYRLQTELALWKSAKPAAAAAVETPAPTSGAVVGGLAALNGTGSGADSRKPFDIGRSIVEAQRAR